MDTDPERKISQDELWEMFGDSIPMEAISIVWAGPDDKTIGQCRAELRALAEKLRHADAPLAHDPETP